MGIPQAPEKIPMRITDLIENVGQEWKLFNENNLFEKDILDHWHDLIIAWADDSSLPLFVRNSAKSRGSFIVHKTGREIIYCDNSPAQWVAEKVFMKEKATLDTIRQYINNDQIPFKFASKKDEQKHAKYKCILNNRLNKAGWKLCHIEKVGLGNQKNISDQDIGSIREKFTLLLDPKNFLDSHLQCISLFSPFCFLR